MKEILLQNIGILLSGVVAALVLAITTWAKDPKRVNGFIDKLFLRPFNRHSIKYRQPISHPIFTQLREYRDIESKKLVFDNPNKQKIWRIYIFNFYRTMHTALHNICADPELDKITEEIFEKKLADSFLIAYTEFIQAINDKIEFPKEVLRKIQRFESRENEYFKFVINVWKNDPRFSEVKKSNSTQLYNILNDMQSRFYNFFHSTYDFFEDLNGALENDTKIKNMNN